MARKLPRSVMERGNLTLYVGSLEHKRKLQKLLELTETPSASAAIYQAIDFYLRAHDSDRFLRGVETQAGKKGRGRRGSKEQVE